MKTILKRKPGHDMEIFRYMTWFLFCTLSKFNLY